jgi:phosphoserine phosphatase RsbU/P
MAARMIPATLSHRRMWLYLAAGVFALVTALFSGIWLYYVKSAGGDRVGMDFFYSLSADSLMITRVRPDWNAYHSGLRPGDRILAINGERLDSLTPFYQFVGRGKEGDTIRLSVLLPGETSPHVVPLVLESPRPLELYSSLSLGKVTVMRIMEAYPLLFLVVGLSVLFLKIEDRNAWLLAVVFAGFIALPDLPAGVVRPGLRGFFITFHVLLSDLLPALLYLFLALFPSPSPLERRAPWLKWVLMVGAGASITRDLWTLIAANAYETIWLPLQYGGPVWVRSSIRALSNLYVLGGQGLALASLIGNSFRTESAEAQRKARVIAWGVSCALLPIMLLVATIYLTGRKLLETPFWLYAFCVLALFLLPLSFAYAVVKHRVLEIPVLLKRSARYVLVQRGFVLLSFLGGITAVMVFIAVFTRIFAAHPERALPAGLLFGVVFGVTWTIAGMQLHLRVGRRIDRAFFRNAYDARMILEELGQQVRAGKDRRSLARLLEREITSALHPQCMAVCFENRPGVLGVQTAPCREECKEIPSNVPLLAELAQRGSPWNVPPEFRNKGLLAPYVPEAECLVPIMSREGRLLGLIGLGLRLSEEPYSNEDKRLLASVAIQVGIALEGLQLAEQMAERLEADQRAARDMEIAREVQARLFPQRLPQLATLEYTGRCIQARQVGGDYFDFLELRPGRVALVLADIAGKGVSGALLMANLQANLRSQYAAAVEDLPRLLASVNRLFHENTSESSYATLFFADYDDATRRLRYVNCGHLPPLLLRSDGRLERLTGTSTVLGLFERWDCAVAEAQLSRGDTLVLYTDGVTEAENPKGEEFGESHLAEKLRANRNLPADCLLDKIVASVLDFSGQYQADDITLVVAKCLGKEL